MVLRAVITLQRSTTYQGAKKRTEVADDLTRTRDSAGGRHRTRTLIQYLLA